MYWDIKDTIKLIILIITIAIAICVWLITGAHAQYGGPPMWDRNYDDYQVPRGPPMPDCIYEGRCRGAPRYPPGFYDPLYRPPMRGQPVPPQFPRRYDVPHYYDLYEDD